MKAETGKIASWVKLGTFLCVMVLILVALFSSNSLRTQAGRPGLLGTLVISDVSLGEVVHILILGFISGCVGGMLGMGGGILKVTNLHLVIGFDLVFARIVSLLSHTVISIAASYKYSKYRLIVWDLTKMLIPASVLGVLLGMAVNAWITETTVELILGIYALVAGIIVLNEVLVKRKPRSLTNLLTRRLNETSASLIGLLMGLVCSVTGISGGILSTPAQHGLMKVPLKNAIANSITAAVFSSAAAATILFYKGLRAGDFTAGTVLLVTACLIPGNIIGGQIGVYLTKVLNVDHLRIVFAVAALCIGFWILIVG